MRVVLCRKPGANGEKLADDIYGEIWPWDDKWFDPQAIQVNVDPECSDTPDGDILLFDSVNGTLSVWLNRREVFAQLDGEYRMGFVQS